MKVPSKYRHALRARAIPPARPRGSGALIASANFSTAPPMTGAICAAPTICAARIRSWRSPSRRARSSACSRSSRWMRSSKSLVVRSSVCLSLRLSSHTVAGLYARSECAETVTNPLVCSMQISHRHFRVEFPHVPRTCQTLASFAATPFEMDHVGLGGQDLPAEEVDRRRAGGRVGPSAG